MSEIRNEEYGYAEVPIPKKTRFWILVCFNIPAFICAVFLLFNLLFKRTLSKELHNHVIILILCLTIAIQLIDVNFYILFAEFGRVWLSAPFFCNLWSFVAVGLYDLIAMLLTWAAIERHILIFHSLLLHTQKKRFIFHYLPLFIVIIYNFSAHIYLIFFPPCETFYDYTQPWCGFPCYFSEPSLGSYDAVANYFLPISLIIIFNFALVVRFIRRKRRANLGFQWRKHRRMILQLLSISLLVLIFFVPMVSLFFAHVNGLPAEIGENAQLYLYFFNYFVVFLLPFVCLASFPDIIKQTYKYCRSIYANSLWLCLMPGSI